MVLNHRNIFSIILLIIACLLVGYFYGKSRIVIPDIEEKTARVDTIYKTIKADKEIITEYKDRIKIVKEKAHGIIYDTVACKEIVSYKDSIINLQDTVILFQDSVIYKYDTIYQIQTEIVNDCKKASNKLDFGLQAGYGASKEGLTPYIGIGINYNPFRK